MEPQLVVAIIGAVATVVAAWVGRKTEGDRPKKEEQSLAPPDSAKGDVSTTPRPIAAARPNFVFVSIVALGLAATALAVGLWPGRTPNAVADALPIGSIAAFTGKKSDVPKNYELCDGELVITSESPIRGHRKPNLFGKFLRGAPADAETLVSGGATTVTLGIDHLPAHVHSLPFKKVRDEIERADNYNRIYLGTVGGGEGGNFVSDAQTESEGKGLPFRIEPPFQDVYWIIRVL